MSLKTRFSAFLRNDLMIKFIDFYALSLLVSIDTFALQDKKSLQLGPEDNLYLEGFALNVFGKADKQDRAGRADLLVHFPPYLCIFFENYFEFACPCVNIQFHLREFNN